MQLELKAFLEQAYGMEVERVSTINYTVSKRGISGERLGRFCRTGLDWTVEGLEAVQLISLANLDESLIALKNKVTGSMQDRCTYDGMKLGLCQRGTAV